MVAVLVVGVIALVGRTSHATSNSNDLAVAGPRTADTPAGYTSYVDTADQFSIAVPSSWTAVNPSSPGAVAALQQVEQNNPDLEATVGSLSNLVAKGVKYFAVYNNGDADQSASVNVAVQPDLGFQDSQLDQLADQLPAQLAKVGATVLGSSNVSLDGNQALRVTIDLPLTNALGNRVTVNETQYYLGSSDFVYVITLAGDSSAFSTIASTFRIK